MTQFIICLHFSFSVDLTSADLRHTFSTLALQSGVDIKTVSGMLGHYSAGFTLDVYGHVTKKMKRDSADRMQQFINSVRGDDPEDGEQ